MIDSPRLPFRKSPAGSTAPNRALALFTVLSMLLLLSLAASHPLHAGNQHPMNQRYLMFNIWTWTAEDTFASFQDQARAARDAGANSLRVHASWALCETTPAHYDFGDLDLRLDFVIRELRLPAAVYIDLTHRPLREGPDPVVPPDELQRNPQGDPAVNWPGRPMISFAATNALARAEAFVAALARHCSARFPDHSILFFEPVFSPYAETEYFPDNDYDHSALACQSFRAWLEARHGSLENLNRSWNSGHTAWSTIEPPLRYDGPDGSDWYAFRHLQLKAAFERMARAIRSGAPSARVSIRFGSVFDASILRRATVLFPDLCAQADIVFVDDAPQYDHAFSMDLLRGSLPGRSIGNEVDGPRLAVDATYAAQIRTSFEHGAQFLTVANWDAAGIRQRQALFTHAAATLLPHPVPGIPADAPPLSIPASTVFKAGYDSWRQRYQELSNQGSRAVRVTFVDDSPHTRTAEPGPARTR